MTTARAHRDRRLSSEEKRTLALLVVPTFGMALAITVVTTYLPKVAKEFVGSTAVIGLLVGGEGLLALFLPLVVGSWSDRLDSRLGGRLPFVLAGTPVMALALVLIGAAGSLPVLAVLVLVFFAAYFVAYEPYRALYPDLIDDEIEGKAQSTQAVGRGAGTGLALACGGLLLSVGQAAPFAVAAFLLLVAVGTFALKRPGQQGTGARSSDSGQSIGSLLGQLRQLVRDHPALRFFLLSNALWELALGALKTFVVLYITVGLGKSVSLSSAVLAVVALIILAASPVSGKLGDRFGRDRVMAVALWVYGLGMLIPAFTRSIPILAATVPLVAFGGGVLMTLPYALLVPMMPKEHHGALTGFYSLSRGLGTMLGPLLAGVAIQVLAGPLSSTHGYAAMWLVAAGAILISTVTLRGLREASADRRELRRA